MYMYLHFQQAENQAARIDTMDEILTNLTDELAQQRLSKEQRRHANEQRPNNTSMKVNDDHNRFLTKNTPQMILFTAKFRAFMRNPHFQHCEDQAARNRIDTMEETVTNLTGELAQQRRLSDEQRRQMNAQRPLNNTTLMVSCKINRNSFTTDST